MSLGFTLYRRSQKAAREHYARLGAAGWSYADISAALRAATTCCTTSELLCSVEMSEREQARVERRGESAEKRLDAIARKYGGRAEFSGDPRGCPVLIGCPGLPRTAWAADGYGID